MISKHQTLHLHIEIAKINTIKFFPIIALTFSCEAWPCQLDRRTNPFSIFHLESSVRGNLHSFSHKIQAGGHSRVLQHFYKLFKLSYISRTEVTSTGSWISPVPGKRSNKGEEMFNLTQQWMMESASKDKKSPLKFRSPFILVRWCQLIPAPSFIQQVAYQMRSAPVQ